MVESYLKYRDGKTLITLIENEFSSDLRIKTYHIFEEYSGTNT